MNRKSMGKDLPPTPLAIADNPPTFGRPPRQTRGQARVEAILDAASAVIGEDGLAAVTMHHVARRARTSIGSMYHFFSDRESLLGALIERHTAAMGEINRQLAETPASLWQDLSTAAAIERLVTPYVTYLRSHADFLPLMHREGADEDHADFVRTIRHVLDARLPMLAPRERENYAAMLHAIAAGVMHVGFQTAPERTDVYLREVPRVLAAYLAEIERGAGK
jgi:AcrR family transcriptional regulator